MAIFFEMNCVITYILYFWVCMPGVYTTIKTKCLFILAVLLAISLALRAQDTTADGLYASARKAAFEDKNNPQAILLCKKALLIAPNYTDIVVFLGRLYTWEKKPDSARVYMQEALQQIPGAEDTYSAYTDLEFWNKNNDTALAIVQKGLSYHPASVELLLRKAKILNEKKDFSASLSVIDSILTLDKGNAEARALGYEIRDYTSKNKIGIRYDHAYFDKQFPDPWDMVSIEYDRLTKAGAFIARINYANRFKMSGYQYELEAYPRISKTFYAFGNIGHSDTMGIFPHWSGGGSLFANLPKAFEAELGFRYLYFHSGILIYTADIGKYYKSFQFGIRTYLVPTLNISQAYFGEVRYYFGGASDFVGLSGGWGIAPDDARVNVQFNTSFLLKSYSSELKLSHTIKKFNVLTLNVLLLNQEFMPHLTGNQLQGGIGYVRRF